MDPLRAERKESMSGPTLDNIQYIANFLDTLDNIKLLKLMRNSEEHCLMLFRAEGQFKLTIEQATHLIQKGWWPQSNEGKFNSRHIIGNTILYLGVDEVEEKEES